MILEFVEFLLIIIINIMPSRREYLRARGPWLHTGGPVMLRDPLSCS